MVVTCASDILAHYDPPLTTIKVPVVSVGKAAANTLIELIETGSAPAEHHTDTLHFHRPQIHWAKP